MEGYPLPVRIPPVVVAAIEEIKLRGIMPENIHGACNALVISGRGEASAWILKNQETYLNALSCGYVAETNTDLQAHDNHPGIEFSEPEPEPDEEPKEAPPASEETLLETSPEPEDAPVLERKPKRKRS